ncbi:MAG TPA: mitochondrial fission ELM1 family protein [Alphaproteobacteria bacterium]
MDKTLSVWVLVERGLTGTEKQCVAVAEALGVEPLVKRISLRNPWRFLSPYINIGIRFGFGEKITPPWPDVLICGGRKSVGLALWIKKMSHDRTFTVCILDPKVHRHKFDLIATPVHDDLKGPNVIQIIGAPNNLTPKRLQEAEIKWVPTFAHLPKPRVAVLIGGSSRTHTMRQSNMEKLAAHLKTLNDCGYGLMITASRRTGDDNTRILRETLAGTNAYIWDGQGDNPYEGFLALADAIIVTSDSVSMLSEAATTGKPVYRFDISGGSARFDAFQVLLDLKGITRNLNEYQKGKLEFWRYPPLNDAADVAAKIKAAVTSGQKPMS